MTARLRALLEELEDWLRSTAEEEEDDGARDDAEVSTDLADRVADELKELAVAVTVVVKPEPDLFDAIAGALEARRDASEKVRAERAGQGLVRPSDVARGKCEAFDEAVALVRIAQAGANLSEPEPNGGTNAE